MANESIESLRVDRMPVNWHGMIASYHEDPPGEDITPLLEGLPRNMCQCPHWGYILSGSIRLRYSDGSEELIEAGHAFYMPAGHTSWTDEDVSLFLLSPEKEFRELADHIKKKREGVG